MDEIFQAVKTVNSFINGIVWGVPVLILIGAVGIYYTVKLHWVQFSKFKILLKNTVGLQTGRDPAAGKKNITSFQAAMMSVSAVVGSGNIAGVATALVCGGPGALFWMIVAALIGMATKYAEIILGVIYQHKNEDGSVEGGAMYYLAEGLHQPWLGKAFSVLVLPFAFVISAVVDSNTIASTLDSRFSIAPVITGIILAVLCGLVILGGMKRVGRVCEWLAPIMGGLYILAGLLIILFNLPLLPNALCQIIQGAFNPEAVTGGAVGSVFMCMKFGIARGMFSNEAGLGTAAMIHSGASVQHPVKQGMWGPIEVFLDTIIICSITALSVIMSGLWKTGEYSGAALTMQAFETMLPGSMGGWICLGSIILFGFSCLISCYTYAQRAAVYLFGNRSLWIIKLIWVLCIVIGSVSTLGFVWDLSDTFNGMMIIPNLIGLILLRKQVIASHNDFWNSKQNG